MSSHRARKHSPEEAAASARAPQAQPGSPPGTSAPRAAAPDCPHRRCSAAPLSSSPPSARPRPASAISSHDHSAARRPRPVAAYVANLSSASLEGRDVTQVSRSGARPDADQRSQRQDKAEKQAQARDATARSQPRKDAEKYAQELSSDTWVMPTTGFHVSTWFGEAGGYWSSGYPHRHRLRDRLRHPGRLRHQRHRRPDRLGRPLRQPDPDAARERRRGLVQPPQLDRGHRRRDDPQGPGDRPRRRHRQRLRLPPALRVPAGGRPARRRRPAAVLRRARHPAAASSPPALALSLGPTYDERQHVDAVSAACADRP